MTARYALYFAPSLDSPWWRAGTQWLGRCAASGREREQLPVPGVEPAVLRALTADPRRYGFHATLKPPFRLARGARYRDLADALDRFCEKQTAFRIPPLRVAELDGFLALVPSAEEPRLNALAAACVRGLDRFRAPPSASELARRRRTRLPPREDALLRRWGYPYVLDRFRFHLSLTGRLDGIDPAVALALRTGATEVFGPLEHLPLVVDSICVFEEPAAGADLRIVHRAGFRHRGRLVYVVGPSGAGKDSLIDWVRGRLPADSPVRIARRTITRPAAAGGESHRAVSEVEFEAMLASGEFAMHWRANGLAYAVGNELREWLSQGLTVVVSGSRAHLPQALAEFPQVEVVHVTAERGVLLARLQARGRENHRQIERRIARAAAPPIPPTVPQTEIRNESGIPVAGRELLEQLMAPAGPRAVSRASAPASSRTARPRSGP